MTRFMRQFILAFNHEVNHAGIVVQAYDMMEARQIAYEEIKQGFKISAIITEQSKVFYI